MKHFIILLALLMVSNSAFAYEYSTTVLNSVNVNQRVNYNPTTSKWKRNVNPENINFIKQITIGSGSFSEYVSDSHYYDTNTTYEFLDNGKLIGQKN